MVASRTRPAKIAASQPPRMTTRALLEQIRQHTLASLPPDLGSPEARIRFQSLQISFADPRLHYEVWPIRKTGLIEIGLHIEGPHDWSRAVARVLAAQADDLRRALGPGYELEDWTASWSRLHTTVPLTRLTPALADSLTTQLLHLIQTAEPLLRASALPEPPARIGAGRERRFHSRHRRRGYVA